MRERKVVIDDMNGGAGEMTTSAVSEPSSSPVLERVVDVLAQDVATLLEMPGETAGQIDSLRDQLESLKDRIGARGLRAALSALEDATHGERRIRQKEIADAVVKALRPLGVRLEAKAPPKRPGRRNGS